LNKKITLGLAISLIAIASAVTFILTSFFSLQSFNKKLVDFNEKSAKYEKLNSLDTLVRDLYFGEIEEDQLSSGILKGYMNGIGDKYSRYLTADEYQEMLAEDNGMRVGLGITVGIDESG
jgi:carboxyl-terminal processing protease